MDDQIRESIQVKERLLASKESREAVYAIIAECIQVYKRGGKLLIAGNGGSAADAQHFAAEVTCQYKATRKGRPAIALHTDTSALTAWSNDKSFKNFFARQIEALGTQKDMLLVISTSGNSPNLIEAVEKAREMGIHTSALLGRTGGALYERGVVDTAVIVPSENTPRIQECHIMIIHIICEALDTFFVQQDQISATL